MVYFKVGAAFVGGFFVQMEDLYALSGFLDHLYVWRARRADARLVGRQLGI